MRILRFFPPSCQHRAQHHAHSSGGQIPEQAAPRGGACAKPGRAGASGNASREDGFRLRRILS